MRRAYWLLALVPFACSNDEDDTPPTPRITRMVVSPGAFLGEVVCADRGGMEGYQATLVDVTYGLDDAFVLPHSKIVSCSSALSFEFIQPGRFYIARVTGFDRSDIEAQNPGSSVVVDADGKSVVPRWTTTCWGHDGKEPPPVGMGGSAPEPEDSELGGAGGAPAWLGIQAYYRASIVIRGCEAMKDANPSGPTGVSFDIQTALLGQSCGTGEGEVDHFTIAALSPYDDTGGAGGAGQVPSSASCGEELIVDELPPEEYLDFEGFAYEDGKASPTWSTTCQALTVAGVVVNASCSALREL